MLSQELHQGMLNTLESLSPTEQEALVLSNTFGTARSTVAGIGGQPQPECRHLTDHARFCRTGAQGPRPRSSTAR
jgi:RNA polymerase sigma-70 factor, ECF subfamily